MCNINTKLNWAKEIVQILEWTKLDGTILYFEDNESYCDVFIDLDEETITFGPMFLYEILSYDNYHKHEFKELAAVTNWDNLSYDEEKELLQNIIAAAIASDYSTYINCSKYTDYSKYTIAVNEVAKLLEDMDYYEILSLKGINNIVNFLNAHKDSQIPLLINGGITLPLIEDIIHTDTEEL